MSSVEGDLGKVTSGPIVTLAVEEEEGKKRAPTDLTFLLLLDGRCLARRARSCSVKGDIDRLALHKDVEVCRGWGRGCSGS